MHCMRCGGYAEMLQSGGCGGRGGLSGCRTCDIVYEQTNGGFLTSTPAIQQKQGTTYFEIRLQLAENNRPRECNHGDEKGKWFWSELNWAGNHYYNTEDEAKVEHEAYVKKIADEVPNPDCTKCGSKLVGYGLRRPATIFRCRNWDCREMVNIKDVHSEPR